MKKIIIAVLLLLSLNAFAGGPSLVSGNTGEPQRWGNKGVTFHLDKGNFCDGVDNARAEDWVVKAIGQWNNFLYRPSELPAFPAVKSSALEVKYGGKVEHDITAKNYGDYLNADLGKTVIIFDEDGSIIADQYGIGNESKIGGLSNPILSDAKGEELLKGIVIINGALFCKAIKEATGDEKTKLDYLMMALIFHEIGHVLNLDHAVVNANSVNSCDKNGACPEAQYITTMFPELMTLLQFIPDVDDMAALSYIYPTQAFKEGFCTVKGRLVDHEGKALNGVNVIARRVGDGDQIAKSDARSNVTGSYWEDCNGEGRYILPGLVPNMKYQVSYEPLLNRYQGKQESSYRPILLPPQKLQGEVIKGADGGSVVSCSKGGEVIDMPEVSVSSDNPCFPNSKNTGQFTTNNNGGNGGETAGSTKPPSCSLNIGK